jgi:hypothetical protein
MRKIILITLLLALPLVCFGQDATTNNLKPLSKDEYNTMLAIERKETFKGILYQVNYIYFTPQVHPRPLTLLRFLVTNPKVIVSSLTKIEGETIYFLEKDMVKNWVKKEDVAELINYVKSRQPAAHFTTRVTIPEFEPSTVGIEAMLMIASYCDKNCPPTNFFTEEYTFVKQNEQDILAEKYLKWWEIEKSEVTSPAPKATVGSPE